MNKRWQGIAAVGIFFLGMLLYLCIKMVDPKYETKQAALMSRLFDLQRCIDFYLQKNGRYPTEEEYSKWEGFEFPTPADPFSTGQEPFRYARISTATGEKCQIYSRILTAPIKIGWATEGSERSVWVFTSEFDEYRRD